MSQAFTWKHLLYSEPILESTTQTITIYRPGTRVWPSDVQPSEGIPAVGPWRVIWCGPLNWSERGDLQTVLVVHFTQVAGELGSPRVMMVALGNVGPYENTAVALTSEKYAGRTRVGQVYPNDGRNFYGAATEAAPPILVRHFWAPEMVLV